MIVHQRNEDDKHKRRMQIYEVIKSIKLKLFSKRWCALPFLRSTTDW